MNLHRQLRQLNKHMKKAQQLMLTEVNHCTESVKEMLRCNYVTSPYTRADKQISRASNLRVNVQILKSLNI